MRAGSTKARGVEGPGGGHCLQVTAQTVQHKAEVGMCQPWGPGGPSGVWGLLWIFLNSSFTVI